MTERPQPTALDRKQTTDVLHSITTVTDALQRLPYRDAVEPLMAVHELQAALYKTLPGGFAGICTDCDMAVGKDEQHEIIFGDVFCIYCAELHDLPTISPAKESEHA